MPSCNLVPKDRIIECGKKKGLTKITINIPNKTVPLVKFACSRHGNERFNMLSITEIKLKKQLDMNKINYEEYNEEIRKIRWQVCRKCFKPFTNTDTVCEIDYHWLKEIRVTLRRSFLLHLVCTNQELEFYEPPKMKTNQTLEEAGLQVE